MSASVVPAAAGTLYVVATPIGNLDDISARALRILGQVALIAAEDTRHSVRLLQHFGIATPLAACHEHNERDQGGRFLARGMPAQVYEAAVHQRAVLIEFDSVAQATGAHDSPEYQRALKALGNGAERDIRIVEAME